MPRLAALAVLLVAGCRQDAPPPAAPPVARPPTAVADPACAKATGDGPIAWIHDDYAAALACARSRDVPVVLDLWAPWCHTCLSMQSTVFTDRSFAADAPTFVFAALDTDKPENEAVVAKFPLSAWPTFYVIGHDETVLARFVGAASVAQFHAFLDNGARAKGGTVDGPDKHLLAAERAVAAKDLATADQELGQAIALAPPTWPRRADALVSWIGVQRKRGKLDECVALAEQRLDETGSSASASDFLYHAIDCAAELEKQPGFAPAGSARLVTLRERAAVRWTALVDDATAPLSVDDRSDALANLRELLITVGKPAEARAVAERQRKLLDDAADAAPTPTAAMTYIWPRSEVYVHLGRPLELVPTLEALAAKLPTEYDVPARIGWLYWQGDKLAEAATWTDRAIALVYGPRKARLLGQRADIAKAAGDAAAERSFRQQVVVMYEALPPGQALPDALARAQQQLAELK